ncbi:MAG: NUDIX domain-containing protein [Lentisphaerae bacterium]|nr:NUDIX domain-containing protein [Lentisphaerota bacterium]
MIHVAAAVIIQNGKVLLASRPADKPPAGWEFPGGKLEPGETVAAAAIRELREELDIQITAHEELYQLQTGKLILTFIRCEITGNETPVPQENQQFRWEKITPDAPAELLPNDLEFWKFLNSIK